MNPKRVEGLLSSTCGISSFQFAIPKDTMSQLLTIMESYRKKKSSYYYETSKGQGKGPVRNRRRKRSS